MDRWAIDTLQWKLDERILLPQKWKWDRGWLQYRAQEEAAKLWVRRMPPARCADGDPLYSMFCRGRGREGGAGAGHGGRTLHIQHCPNSRSDGMRPCCRTMEIVSPVSLVSLVPLVPCVVPLVPCVVSLAYVKGDLSPSRAVRGGVPTGGGTVAKNGLQTNAGNLTQCSTGGTHTSPAGVDPSRRIRRASPGQIPLG